MGKSEQRLVLPPRGKRAHALETRAPVLTLLRGHLYWAQMPGEKRRPVLVLSPDVRNERAHDVIVAPVTSARGPSPTHVRIRAGEAGAHVGSVIACERITTLERDLLDPTPLGGPISRDRFGEVARAILRAIGVAVD